MAKYGKVDKPSIVEDRPDGANVRKWHWAAIDCLEWSRNLLSELLSDLNVLDGEGNLYIKTKKIEKVDGEAYVSLRKGKIIPGYEISLTLPWEGEAKDADGKSLLKADGLVEIPCISDENADEDPELKVWVKDEGPIGKRLKEAMLAKGIPLILEKVRVYVQSMAKGGPAKDDLDLEKTTPKAQPAASTAVTLTAQQKEPVVEKGEAQKKRFRTITFTGKFNYPASRIFEILMDENLWERFTQSSARISKEVGGEFSIFDGSVTGTNVVLQEGKWIVQEWRFWNWPDGIYSRVTMFLCEPQSGVTIVNLTHNDIPEEDRYGNSTVVKTIKRGWGDLIFDWTRAVFHFGDAISEGLSSEENDEIAPNVVGRANVKDELKMGPPNPRREDKNLERRKYAENLTNNVQSVLEEIRLANARTTPIEPVLNTEDSRSDKSNPLGEEEPCVELSQKTKSDVTEPRSSKTDKSETVDTNKALSPEESSPNINEEHALDGNTVPPTSLQKDVEEPSPIEINPLGKEGLSSEKFEEAISASKKPGSEILLETSSNAKEKISSRIGKSEVVLTKKVAPDDGNSELVCREADNISSQGEIPVDKLVSLREAAMKGDWYSQVSSQGEIPADKLVSLREAAMKGDWYSANSVLQQYKNAIRAPIGADKKTALHIAVAAKQTNFVGKLMMKMSAEDIILPDDKGNTAFSYVAIWGNVNCAKEMIKKNNELPSSRNSSGQLPIHHAVRHGRRNMADHLLSLAFETPSDYLTHNDRIQLLTQAIRADMFDIALKILRKDPTLSTARDPSNFTVLKYLAEKSELSWWWKRCYNLCDLLMVEKICFKGPWYKKFMQPLGHQLVEELCRHIEGLPGEQSSNEFNKQLSVVHNAVESGNVEFLNIILRFYPDFTCIKDQNGKDLREVAKKCGRVNVSKLINKVRANKNSIADRPDDGVVQDSEARHDDDGKGLLTKMMFFPISIVKKAGKLLEVQLGPLRTPPAWRTGRGGGGDRRGDADERNLNSKESREKEKEWMIRTAQNCTIVSTLITAATFNAALTPPGDSDEGGSPKLLKEKWFSIFYIANATAFIFSTSSIFAFLSHLTSRYNEEDDFKLLRKIMVAGLVTLFIAIVGKVISFSAACFLRYQSKTAWVPIAIIALTAVPAILFAGLHSRILIELICPPKPSNAATTQLQV